MAIKATIGEQALFGKLLAAIVLWVVFPNLLFWGIALALAINRAVFNLDYLFVGVLFAAGRKYLGSVLLLACLLLDLLSMVGLLFPFVRVQDVSYLLGLLPYAAPVWQFSFAGLLFLVAGVVYVIWRYGARTDVAATLIIFNLGLFGYGVYVYRPAEAGTDRWYRTSEKWVDSQGISFISNRSTEFIDFYHMPGNPLSKVGFKGETKAWAEAPSGALNRKLLLIVAESWGQMNDGRIDQALLAPLLERRDRFDWFRSGTKQGGIATVGAELRELCGLDTRHYNLKPVEEGFSDCLPWLLKKQGYATSAIHGSVGLMYDRLYWYPRAGFDEAIFKESQAWTTQCYSFPGVCDREIASSYIAHAFEKDEKKFVYWLTLNSHAIYDERDIHEDLFDCPAYGLVEGTEVCRMLKLHAQFFHDFAAVLDNENMNGVEVLIVGDHQPRLLAMDEMEKVREGAVSWVHFRIGD